MADAIKARASLKPDPNKRVSIKPPTDAEAPPAPDTENNVEGGGGGTTAAGPEAEVTAGAKPTSPEAPPPTETPAAAEHDQQVKSPEEGQPSTGEEVKRVSLPAPAEEAPSDTTATTKTEDTAAKYKRRKSMFEEPVEEGAEGAAGPGGAALQSDGGNLTKTLETYFGQQTQTTEKPGKPVRKPRLVFENTYRLFPKKPFSVQNVERAINSVLNEMMPTAIYRVDEAGDLANVIAEKIRNRVLSLHFERFKIIVLVSLGQMKRQGMHIGFRNLWDVANDSYAFGEFRNQKMYCAAQVYGIYFE